MESLDSLWFYSNVLSSRTSVVSDSGSYVCKDVQDEHAVEEVLKPFKPVLQIVEDEKIEPELIAEVVECYSSESSPSPSPREKEQRRRKQSRSKRSLQSTRRRILGELDCDWILNDEEDFGYKNQFNLSDNLAMKEHLKTWDHAVACTVR